MRKFLPAAALLAAATASAAISPRAQAAAHRELKLGLLAHIDGHNQSALHHFARCLRLGAPTASDDINSCHVFMSMFGKERAKGDGASKPAARRVYKAAVAAYKKGDLAAADKGWRQCLDLSVVATAVRNDCLAALSLLPRMPPGPSEAPARDLYVEGVMFFSEGRNDKAIEAFRRCLKEAPTGSYTENDCKVGLQRLHAR